MTKVFQTFMIATLAGTSLSGCAIFSGKEVWPGDRTFVQFMTTPIGELLRGAPEEEVQFANETETEELVVETTAVETDKTEVVQSVEVVESEIKEDALDWDDVVVDYLDAPVTATTTKVETVKVKSAEPVIETVEIRETDRVLSQAEIRSMLAKSGGSHSGTVTTQTTSYQSGTLPALRPASTVTTSSSGTVSSMSSSSTSTTTTSSMTVHSAPTSTSYLTVDNDVSYVLMGGGASLADWRACEAKTGTYWTFDDETHVGRLNPSFETCMTSQNYKVETSIETEVIQPSEPVTVTTTSTFP